MKLYNVPLAIFVLLVTLLALGAASFGLSFIWDIGLKTADGGEPTDFASFVVRVFVGIAAMGCIHGLGMLYDLFAYCLRIPYTKGG